MKLDEMFDLIYCINLDEREDRWKTSQKEFEKIGLQPTRFSAVKHETPFLGCLESHLNCLKQGLIQNKNVLIFEDDVQFVNYDADIMEEALDELAVMRWWDMFYIGGNILRPFYQITNRLAKLSHCQSTHAYGVNKRFLPSLIGFLQDKKEILDVMYADGVIPYNNCFITIPMMAIQRESFSDIEKIPMTYDVPVARYTHFLVTRKCD